MPAGASKIVVGLGAFVLGVTLVSSAAVPAGADPRIALEAPPGADVPAGRGEEAAPDGPSPGPGSIEEDAAADFADPADPADPEAAEGDEPPVAEEPPSSDEFPPPADEAEDESGEGSGGSTELEEDAPDSSEEHADSELRDAVTVEVSGVVQTMIAEPAQDAQPGEPEEFQVLVLEDGALLNLDTGFDSPPRESSLVGEIFLPDPVVEAVEEAGVAVEPGETIAADTPKAEQALELLLEMQGGAQLASATITPPDIVAAAPTHHRLYVAQIANRGAHPANEVISKTVVDAMNYWAEQSEGNATMSWEAWYTYNSASATVENKCGLSIDMAAFNTVVNEAQTLVYPNVNFTTSANHLIVLVPEACMAGGRVGVASSGLNFSSGGRLAAYTGASGPGALAHEIGHNLGFGHEYGWYCGNPCKAVVYGDVYGVMGSNVVGGLPAMSTPFREHHGILGAGEVLTVRSDATFTLQPRSARSGLRGLKIPDAQGVVFYVDYRSGTGRDANTYNGSQVWPMGGFNSVYPPGVTILYRIDSQQGMPETYLQTYPRQSLYYGSLAQGQSFKSPVSDLQIKVGSMGSNGAQVSLQFAATGKPSPNGSGPFADVPNNHKFGKEIRWMYTSGLSTGVKQATGKPKYLPKSSVSREAMAAFLYRLEGTRFTGPKRSPFADVPPSHKFYDEISWMYFEGLSTGVKQRSGKPKYLPKSSVSREAMAAFLYRLDGSRYIGLRISPFVDVSTSHKFYDEISWMRSTGLSTGVKQATGKPKYLPKSSVSREAMAAFLYRHEH